MTEIFKIPRVKVLETWNEQESYWRAKRTEIETVHAVEKQKITDKIAAMDAEIKILAGVPKMPKYVLKKLGLYGDFSLHPPFSFEFPT